MNDERIKIIPLGGLEHIGMNITVFEYEDEIIVVDCGLSFPTDDMLGIDLVIPDVTYLKENREKIGEAHYEYSEDEVVDDVLDEASNNLIKKLKMAGNPNL